MNDHILISHRIISSVSLGVFVVDDLTGNPVIGSNVRVWIDHQKPPIKKGDGWFVFTDLACQSYTIHAEGGFYQKTSLDYSVSDSMTKTVTIRLTPSRNYPVPEGMLRVEGKADPFAEITVCLPDKNSSCKLLTDAEKNSSELMIYHTDLAVLDGCCYRLVSDGFEEDITIANSLSENHKQYRLTDPLREFHPRTGSVLFPLKKTRADQNGSFFLVIRSCSETAGIVFESRGVRFVRREYHREGQTCLRPDLTE